MKKIIEKLWGDCFCEECALIETEEERSLAKKAVEMREALNKSLSKTGEEVSEKYIDTLYEIQGHFIKKAFFK